MASASALAWATVWSAVRCASSSVRLIFSASSSLADGRPGLAGAAGDLLRHLLQLGDGGAGPSFHRRGLVLGGLDRGGDLSLKSSTSAGS